MEHTGYKPLEKTVIDSLLTQAEVLIEQVKRLEVLDRNDLYNCDTIMSGFLDPVNHHEQGATGKYFQMVELGKYYYRDIERREVWFDENNAKCLRNAIDLLKNVKKEYEEFVQALSGVKERKEQHDLESKTWTVTKSLFGIGSVAKYTNMTRDIPKSLYFIMLVFAFAILYFESVFIERCKHYRQQLKKTQTYYTGINIQEMKNIATPYAIYKECYRLLSESSDNPVSSVKKFIDDNIRDVFSLVDPTDKNTDISTGGASRRRTRHNQYHQHHHHRRKTVRRNKKSRKVKKMLRTKHRIHRRKLNKSKTKQRK
jgi:hypothetical protein